MKHCRTIIKRLKDEIPGLQIALLRQRTHQVYELRLGDKVRHLTMSVSPKNYDRAIELTVKAAKQLLNSAR
ncbi:MULTISPECIES: hypothetical protein [unclassified Acidovorax]|uniref:hypothetical protein n=1 Tax=unclassified Acidovorax TaxID=2684926 RepID=UPI000B405227|nr:MULTISPECIES: hypothetical protein [unclassified Acidovorax]